MKRFSMLFAIVCLALWCAGAAEAQTRAGDQELSFTASYYKAVDGDSDGTLSANVRFGQYLTDHFELGGGVILAGEIDDIDRFSLFEVFGQYNFSPQATNTTYLRIGYVSFFDDPAEGFADAAFGFKSYFQENAAFFWEGAYGTPIGDFEGDLVRSTAGLVFRF